MYDTNTSEMCVIGGILQDGKGTADVYSLLVEECFSGEDLGHAFALCKQLHDEQKEVDIVNLLSLMGDEYKPLLIHCAELVPTLSGFYQYVGNVRDAWRRREIAKEAQEIALEAQEPEMKAHTLVRRISSLLDAQMKIEEALTDRTAKGFSDAANEFYANLVSEDNSIKTGWSNFDIVTGGFQRKGVYVISARSGKGKTDLAINMAMQLAKNYRVNYNTMEMPRVQIMNRVISKATQIPSRKIRDKTISKEESTSIMNMIEALKKQTKLVIDEQAGLTAEIVEAKIVKYRPDVLFIDHLGLMKHKSMKNSWEAIGETTRFLKRLALKYDIVIIELVQLNREADRQSKVTMSSLKGSSDIENDADGIFAVVPEEIEKPLVDQGWIKTEVHIIKNRHGSTGKLLFNWKPYVHSWTEVYEQ